MVRNRGILPGLTHDLVRQVVRQRREIDAIVSSSWGACTQPDPDTPGAAPFRVSGGRAGHGCWLQRAAGACLHCQQR